MDFWDGFGDFFQGFAGGAAAGAGGGPIGMGIGAVLGGVMSILGGGPSRGAQEDAARAQRASLRQGATLSEEGYRVAARNRELGSINLRQELGERFGEGVQGSERVTDPGTPDVYEVWTRGEDKRDTMRLLNPTQMEEFIKMGTSTMTKDASGTIGLQNDSVIRRVGGRDWNYNLRERGKAAVTQSGPRGSAADELSNEFDLSSQAGQEAAMWGKYAGSNALGAGLSQQALAATLRQLTSLDTFGRMAAAGEKLMFSGATKAESQDDRPRSTD